MRPKTQIWPAIVSAIALIIAIGDQPYDYYTLLRWGISAIGIYYTYSFYKKSSSAFWVFGIIAVLFNPIIPFYSTKDSWQFIDLIVAAIFGFCAYAVNNENKIIGKPNSKSDAYEKLDRNS